MKSEPEGPGVCVRVRVCSVEEWGLGGLGGLGPCGVSASLCG